MFIKECMKWGFKNNFEIVIDFFFLYNMYVIEEK